MQHFTIVFQEQVSGWKFLDFLGPWPIQVRIVHANNSAVSQRFGSSSGISFAAIVLELSGNAPSGRRPFFLFFVARPTTVLLLITVSPINCGEVVNKFQTPIHCSSESQRYYDHNKASTEPTLGVVRVAIKLWNFVGGFW